MEIIQHKFRHSNHRIGSLIRLPVRIIPYPTGRLFWMAAVPGTSCQATIIPSLRDKPLWGRRALRVLPGTKCLTQKFGHLQKVTSGDFGPKPNGPRPVGTTPIVARHEVPGKASLERNRPVGYGMIGRG